MSQNPYPPAGFEQPQAPQPMYAPPPSMPPTSQYGSGAANGYYNSAPNANGYGGNGGGPGYGGNSYGAGQQQQQQQQYSAPQGMPPKTQEAQYYQQGQAAGGQGYNAPPQKSEGMIEGRFDDMKPKWNDLIFALIFLAQLGAFIAIAVISLRALPASESTGGIGSIGNATTINASMGWMLAIIAGAGFVFSALLLLIVRTFTKIIFEICLLLSLVTTIGYAIYMYTQKYWSGAIIWTIFAVFAILAYPGMRRRIPLSRQLLIYVIRVAKVHPSVYVVALFGAFLTAAYSAFWGIAVAGIYQKWEPGSAGSGTSGGTPSYGAVTGLMVFAVFNLYYTTQFITNLFLTTEAGIFGAFYYGGADAKKVAWGAFKRASTYSFGSIAFGSLIVALLDLLRAVLQVIQSYESQEGNIIGMAVACVAQCCIGCIAWAVEYFNRYAYIEIALYGKAYIPAAKDTWRLFKDRGITALINDCLVNNIWSFGSLAVGALCSLIAFGYLKGTDPAFIQDSSGLVAVLVGYSFAIGYFISYSLGYGALSSGVSTTFVALAEDPEVLAERDPELFELIRRAYPQVVTSV
ncbi:hypothetical protein JCM10908_006567 [Rhodotorula pacifica]|uniref:Pns1p n=1 Tax=Rhodotorula pacifica TaxID=1495444 RepID=UPI00318005E3